MKIYRTKLSEIKKLVKEQLESGSGEPDPREIENAMLEGTEMFYEELKGRMKSNIIDFARNYEELDASYVASLLYDAYVDSGDDQDAIRKVFMEMYEEEWG